MTAVLFTSLQSLRNHFQKFPQESHWVTADEQLLRAISEGRPVQRGYAGTRLNRLVKMFVNIRLVYLLLFFVGSLELAKLLLRQVRQSHTKSGSDIQASTFSIPSFFFVGFGAGQEEKLFSSYCIEKNSTVARIDQTKVNSMGIWQRVGILQSFTSLFRSLAAVRQAIKVLPEEFHIWKADLLTFAGMRLGYYSFVCTWFKQLKENAPKIAEVCFLTADTAAFAAVDAGLPTLYLQHGLIRHSLFFPAFDRIDALTHEDVIHFQHRLPMSTIRLVRPMLPKVLPRRPPAILVASVYGSHEDMRRIISLLEYANQIGVSIHVRPHPREDRSFWNAIDLPFKVSMEEHDETFDEALTRIQPSLVVSWFSTTLIDALYRGVIPISVCSRDEQNIKDLVYPLFKHCLHWPSDQTFLTKIISNPVVYESTVTRLTVGI